LNVDDEKKIDKLENKLEMVKPEDNIKLIEGLPHKGVWHDGKEYFQEICWDQIPEERIFDLV
jgi:hypothetical protein